MKIVAESEHEVNDGIVSGREDDPADNASHDDALDSYRQQAKSARAFDKLLAQYRKESDSQRLKGNFFEQLFRQYLLHDSQMKAQFDEVHLWKDWTGNKGRPDTGIDLVAIQSAQDGRDAGAVAIQCKFYAPNHRLQKSDVDSFLSESGKVPYVRRIVVETTGAAWSKHAEEAIKGQQIPVARIGLTDLRNSDIDWSTYRLDKPERGVGLLERKTLRDHQAIAIKKVFEGFEKSDRGTLVMACGTGKTFTSLKIAEELAEQRGGSARVLFMVPSLSLMSQTLGEWSVECGIGFHAWSVCSDTKVNRKRAAADDIVDLSIVDLKTPPTTDPKRLASSLVKHADADGLQVVFATYQSIDVVAKATKIGGNAWPGFDLVICDEAHRTTGVTIAGDDESAFVKIHDNAVIQADKRLYMTATPRLYNDKVKDTAKERDAVLCSMDDQAIYGPVFHRLSFGTAVSLGLLTDYKVVVLAVPEDEVSAIYQDGIAQGGELNLPETAKLVGCWNALAKRRNGYADISYGDDSSPMRRAVAFTKDIQTSKWVKKEFPALVRRHLRDLTNDDETDNLDVQCNHVDGSMNAVERGEFLDWLKEDTSDLEYPVCRILTNARCLSEGVDVSTLDAVLFLNPRKSQVDVIQAVGRVMRKAEGKKFGYVVLPVAVPSGMAPEQALSDNKRYQVIWQVLQAIRAHDDRFDNQINLIEFNAKDPTSIVVDVVNLSKPRPGDHFDGAAVDGYDVALNAGSRAQAYAQLPLPFNALEWKEAVYSKIVKKVGNREYWDDWSKDIADVAARYGMLIRELIKLPSHKDDFDTFVETLQKILNPGIDGSQAVEMLAQHIITKPLFDAMFEDQRFTEQNPVSRAMQGILDKLASNAVFEKERRPLEGFYSTMVEKIKNIDTVAGKQNIMKTLYDKFFNRAFPALADRLGIVFTPVPVVDYIIQSANDALKENFGKTLGDRGVSILEPFLGTGTFVTRLLQSGIITPEQLEHKYRNEIFGNEIVLLSYYIASINIETVYREIRREQGYDDGYVEFPGIALTDTFQMHESNGQFDNPGVFQANTERVRRQKDARITAIIMNPPYSVGQQSANDNNQNLKYPALDGHIANTYASRSTGTNKNNLYDSYFRAIRWATDRIGKEGVIVFVSNNSFLDGNTADGVRLTWQEEFSDIYIYNLKGAVRGKIGDPAKREGGNVFGIMTGVAVTVLVKSQDYEGKARIHYAEVGDYLNSQEKLDCITTNKSVSRMAFQRIDPNKHGDWISQRDEQFGTWQAIGDPKTKGNSITPGIFENYSRGLATARDVWCYNYSLASVRQNMARMVTNYNEEVANGHTSLTSTNDPSKISWNRALRNDLDKRKKHQFNPARIRLGSYRPFCKQNVYFDRAMNDMVYQLPQLFPTSDHPNLALGVSGERRRDFSLLMVDILPDLEMVSKAQWCSLYTWEHLGAGSKSISSLLFDLSEEAREADSCEDFAEKFDFTRPIGEQVPVIIGQYRRRDNITGATLKAYQEHYSDAQISKEDIFFYVYALLHHPDYRERYEADLKKMLPHIPKVTGFWEYANIGRKLAELHVNYEEVEHYRLNEVWADKAPEDPWQLYEVKKPVRGKDRTTLRYNDYLTLEGIPAEADEYRIGGRSPLEWVVDRYKTTQDEKSGIVNDPNDYCHETGNPRYIVDLIKSLVTVSLRTRDLIQALPELVVEEEQCK